MSITLELARAGELLRRGALAEAERELHSIVARHPSNADALQLLALLRKQTGDLAGSLELMRQCVALSPRQPAFQGNLGNLLRALGRGVDAEAAYRAALGCDPAFRPARIGLAHLLNELGRPAEAEAEARRLIGRDANDWEAWSALGDALGAREQPAAAELAYQRALRLRPTHAVTRHNLGALLVREQRAEEALAALDRAAADGLRKRELQFNRARALFDLYRFDEADAAMESAVAAEPLDPEAQTFLAKMRYMRGERDFTRSLQAAIERYPRETALRLLLADLWRQAGQIERSESELRDVLATGHESPQAMAALGLVLQEQGRFSDAERWARRVHDAQPEDPAFTENLVVLLLALGRAAESLPLIDYQRGRHPHDQRWFAHLATASRLLGHPMYERLYDYERFVRSFELQPPEGWPSIEAFHRDLVPVLLTRHRLENHPLDQSLRHGTQTARSLLSDRDPVLQALLAALLDSVTRYCAAIGQDESHPFLARNRGAARMTGCWSVRLRREGFHVNHIHPAGWISSAYYVQVPPEVQDTNARAGWIKFGEPNLPTPGASAALFVQPQVGRLVLFPSYMWHGTTPILGDEPRITVAFDAVPA